MTTAPTTGQPAHRDFDADDTALPPSCTFTLGGKKWTCRNSDDVPFAAMRAAMTVQDNGDLQVQIGPLFRAVLIPAQVEKFMAMIEADDSPITTRRVNDLVHFLTEEVLGFPTTPVSGSSPAAKKTTRPGKNTKARSSSPVTRRRASGE